MTRDATGMTDDPHKFDSIAKHQRSAIEEVQQHNMASTPSINAQLLLSFVGQKVRDSHHFEFKCLLAFSSLSFRLDLLRACIQVRLVCELNGAGDGTTYQGKTSDQGMVVILREPR